MNLEIRRPLAEEHGRIRDLVSQVVNETYDSIWPTTPIHVDEEDWSGGWIAVTAGNLMGWLLTKDRWLEDLWVASGFWSQGVGSALLSHAEREIGARGIATAHLSVIASNTRAIAFYERRGWRWLRETPHEFLPIPRVEMTKNLG